MTPTSASVRIYYFPAEEWKGARPKASLRSPRPPPEKARNCRT
ncbi:MAG: hypothetical protein ABR562_07615 [Thermoplasmatota archaeon]